jgi:hypothetical protein
MTKLIRTFEVLAVIVIFTAASGGAQWRNNP